MDYSNSNISFYKNNGLLENNEEDSNIFHQQYFIFQNKLGLLLYNEKNGYTYTKTNGNSNNWLEETLMSTSCSTSKKRKSNSTIISSNTSNQKKELQPH